MRNTTYPRLVATALAISAIALLLPASASAGGGLKPSQAPLVAVGQHYFGNTYRSANVGCCETADLWRLPPLLTADVLTVAWNATEREPRLCLAQDVDDYSWAEYDNQCNGSQGYGVSGSGSARTSIEVKSSTTSPFLEFWGNECCESQPYDFTVESIQHALGVGLQTVYRVRPTTTLSASASLTNGAPVPDGLKFFLKASSFGQVLGRYEGISSGGVISFPITLPPEAVGQYVTLTVVRPADAQYLAAKSAGLKVKVARVSTSPRHRHRHHHHRHHRHRH